MGDRTLIKIVASKIRGKEVAMVVEFLFLRIEAKARIKLGFVKKRSRKTKTSAYKSKH